MRTNRDIKMVSITKDNVLQLTQEAIKQSLFRNGRVGDETEVRMDEETFSTFESAIKETYLVNRDACTRNHTFLGCQIIRVDNLDVKMLVTVSAVVVTKV